MEGSPEDCKDARLGGCRVQGKFLRSSYPESPHAETLLSAETQRSCEGR